MNVSAIAIAVPVPMITIAKRTMPLNREARQMHKPLREAMDDNRRTV